jgi:hypothetical protein
MTPVAHIEHKLPGRVRLRIPSRRGEVAFFEKVVRALSGHPAIWEIAASPLAASLTLHYSEPLQDIAAAAAQLALFEITQPKSATGEGDPTPAGGSGGDGGLASSLAAGLSGLGLYQVCQGNVVGSAVESLWLAFNARAALGRPNLAMAFVAIGVRQFLKGELFGSAASLFFYALILYQLAGAEQAKARALPAVRTAKAMPG